MADKKYYWLKLKTDFFNQREIKKLRRLAGGDTLTIIYLRIQLLSLSNNGEILFAETEEDMAEQLSIEIDENIENVRLLLGYLQANNLIEIKENQDLTMVETKELIGSESSSANRVRKLRQRNKNTVFIGKELAQQQDKNEKALQCNTNVTKCNIDIDIEKDIELDIDNNILSAETDLIDTKKESKTKYNYFNDVAFITKSERIVEILNETLGKKFSNKSKATLRLIHARLNEGRTVKDFEYVIKNQFNNWNGTEWQKYLRPETLFGTKFEGYLNSVEYKAKPKDLNQKPKYEKPKY